MMKQVDTTEKLFSPTEAKRVAAELEANDPGCMYVARHDPKGTGYSFIEIYDEDGVFVGKW